MKPPPRGRERVFVELRVAEAVDDLVLVERDVDLRQLREDLHEVAAGGRVVVRPTGSRRRRGRRQSPPSRPEADARQGQAPGEVLLVFRHL